MKLYKRLYINSLILNGNKSRAYFFACLVNFSLKNKLGFYSWFIVYKSLRNVFPLVGLRRLKLGGINYKVPVPISFRKSLGCSVRWLFHSYLNGRRLGIKDIFLNILAAFFKKGSAIRSKRDWYRLAVRNRLYIRFVI